MFARIYKNYPVENFRTFSTGSLYPVENYSCYNLIRPESSLYITVRYNDSSYSQHNNMFVLWYNNIIVLLYLTPHKVCYSNQTRLHNSLCTVLVINWCPPPSIIKAQAVRCATPHMVCNSNQTVLYYSLYTVLVINWCRPLSVINSRRSSLYNPP